MITSTMRPESMKAYFKHLFLILVLFFQGCAVISEAPSMQEVRIVDCNGRTKALKDVASDESTSLKVTVSDTTADGATVILVNNIFGERSAIVQNGAAQFDDLSSGIWVLSSNRSLFFSDLAFESTPVPFYESSGVETALVVAAGIITGIVIHDTTNGHGGHGAGQTDSPVTPPKTCPTCNPNQDAPSIAPFSLLN